MSAPDQLHFFARIIRRSGSRPISWMWKAANAATSLDRYVVIGLAYYPLSYPAPSPCSSNFPCLSSWCWKKRTWYMEGWDACADNLISDWLSSCRRVHWTEYWVLSLRLHIDDQWLSAKYNTHSLAISRFSYNWLNWSSTFILFGWWLSWIQWYDLK